MMIFVFMITICATIETALAAVAFVEEHTTLAILNTIFATIFWIVAIALFILAIIDYIQENKHK